jgi:hypothetical protein
MFARLGGRIVIGPQLSAFLSKMSPDWGSCPLYKYHHTFLRIAYYIGSSIHAVVKTL